MNQYINYLKFLFLFTFATTSLLFAQSNNMKNITDKAIIRYSDNQIKGEITILANSNTIAAVYVYNVSLRDLMNYARFFKLSKISQVK